MEGEKFNQESGTNFLKVKEETEKEYLESDEQRKMQLRRQVLEGSLLPETTDTVPFEKSFEFVGDGGTRYGNRNYQGKWPDLFLSIGNDYLSASNFPNNEQTFGVGERGGRRFIYIIEKQNIQDRGGYMYTFIMDPGDRLWKKSGWNAALIIRNIMEDPILRDICLKYPERIATSKFRENLCLWLEQSDWNIKPERDQDFEKILEKSKESKARLVLGQKDITRPTPDELAHALAALPESERKSLSFLIGGNAGHGAILGSKIIWDHWKK